MTHLRRALESLAAAAAPATRLLGADAALAPLLDQPVRGVTSPVDPEIALDAALRRYEGEPPAAPTRGTPASAIPRVPPAPRTRAVKPAAPEAAVGEPADAPTPVDVHARAPKADPRAHAAPSANGELGRLLSWWQDQSAEERNVETGRANEPAPRNGGRAEPSTSANLPGRAGTGRSAPPTPTAPAATRTVSSFLPGAPAPSRSPLAAASSPAEPRRHSRLHLPRTVAAGSPADPVLAVAAIEEPIPSTAGSHGAPRAEPSTGAPRAEQSTGAPRVVQAAPTWRELTAPVPRAGRRAALTADAAPAVVAPRAASLPIAELPLDPLAVDLDVMDAFTRALDRVLAREARRHGIEVDDA